MIAGIWSATNETPPWRKLLAAFRRGLQNLRWIEGRNVNIEERWPSEICGCAFLIRWSQLRILFLHDRHELVKVP
jgi:hypothetical protein